VDEIALAEALREKKVAGAADRCVCHGTAGEGSSAVWNRKCRAYAASWASTDEAQTAVSVEACKAIVAYLNTGEIRGAVNAGGLKLDLPADELPLVDWREGLASCLPRFAMADIAPLRCEPVERELRST